MLIFATSYEGALLLLQFPLSAICALGALILAFTKKTRAASVGFASVGILVTVGAAVLEFLAYGLYSFTRARADSAVFWSLALAPMIVCIAVLALGSSTPRTNEPKA